MKFLKKRLKYNVHFLYKNMPSGNDNLTLWQQAMKGKNQEQELYNFLSIGCGGRCREQSRQLYLALKRKKEIKICRKQVIRIMRNIGLDRGFACKITRMLEKSGLSISQQRTLAKQIKKILLDFKRDLHRQLDLSKINLRQLPLSLRRFLVALLVLKAEIANLFRLRCEADLKRIQEENLKLSISHNDVGLASMNLNIDNHKSCATGVSLTKGIYDGLGLNFEKKQEKDNYYDVYNDKNIFYQNHMDKNDRNRADTNQKNNNKYDTSDKNINLSLYNPKDIEGYVKTADSVVNYGYNTTKEDRNKADILQKNEQQYQTEQKITEDIESNINKKDFYNEKIISIKQES